MAFGKALLLCLRRMLLHAKASVTLAEELDYVICQKIRLLHSCEMPSCTCTSAPMMQQAGPAVAAPRRTLL